MLASLWDKDRTGWKAWQWQGGMGIHSAFIRYYYVDAAVCSVSLCLGVLLSVPPSLSPTTASFLPIELLPSKTTHKATTPSPYFAHLMRKLAHPLAQYWHQRPLQPLASLIRPEWKHITRCPHHNHRPNQEDNNAEHCPHTRLQRIRLRQSPRLLMPFLLHKHNLVCRHLVRTDLTFFQKFSIQYSPCPTSVPETE